MVAFVKKIHRHSDELLHLALILSLLRVDPESYLGLGGSLRIRDGTNVTMGETWAHIPYGMQEVPYLHPKSIGASLARYQEELMDDLNDLGRYGLRPVDDWPRTVAYLMDGGGTSDVVVPGPSSMPTVAESTGSDLTAEVQEQWSVECTSVDNSFHGCVVSRFQL